MHVVLIPGYLLDQRLWTSVMHRIEPRATLSVPDLTGFDCVDAMAEHVLQQAPPRFVLIGLSMGGYVSLSMMRKAPQRIQALALLNTQAGVDQPATLARREKLRDLVAGGGLAQAKESLKPLMLHPDRLAPGQAARTLLDAMHAGCDEGVFLRQQKALNRRRDNHDLLRTIQCPTLVLGARQDVLTPPAIQQAMAEAIPNARLVILENAGHLSPIEKPEAVAATLEAWLSEYEGSAAWH